jgi:UDP-2,3-diacylglucosamine hydrolase
MPAGKKIYFASDFHLGIPDYESSLIREKMLVTWLENVRMDAHEIYLMGDVFDFWFEYKSVVPKGYVRLLGKLADISDSGIPVFLFTGNHDIWAFDYLPKEIGITIYREPQIRIFNGKVFYLAHGDGLGPGDLGYKLIKWIFGRRFNQWIFRWLHPDIGARIALYFSRKSRTASDIRDKIKLENINIEDEWLYHHSLDLLKNDVKADYFVYGHRHLPTHFALTEKSRLIILGDWITNFTYGVFDGEKMELKHFTNDNT